MTKQWVNWHAHSTGSMLDGASRFVEYAETAKEQGNPAITFTDHGNIHGLLDGYDAAQSVGIKYFPGMEAYQARKTRFDKDEDERAGKARSEWDQRGPYHLGIIAYNNEGYHNLIKLSSRAFLEGFFVKPRIDHELIEEHKEGLVVTSGCLSGEVQQAILRGDNEAALGYAAKMQDIVGKDNYFIEFMNHGIDEEAKTWETLKYIAHKIDAPMIVTCDSHYTKKEDAYHHDLTLCISTGARQEDENRFKFSGDEFYLKTYDEMVQLFGEEEYVKNTMLIYEKHDLNLKFDENHYPKYAADIELSSEQLFDREVALGAARRFGDDWKEQSVILDRVTYESEVIKEMGFVDYFLVVSDIVKWAKDNNILVGPARGSAAGSLVSFCLFITEVDPLKYGLIFERFLVPGRKSPPDIDLDFDSRYRDQVIEYTRQKYGYDHTAQIGTMGTIKAKKAVRDISRVLSFPYELGDQISKAMPPSLFGVPPNLDECLKIDSFRKLYDESEDVRTVIDQAKKIEGLWRDPGVHAAGLVVADRPITEYVPVLQKGVDKPIVTQWEMGRIDQLGLLKIDFLGLRNLDIISMCLEEIKETKNIVIENPYELLDLAEDDPIVFQTLSRGHTTGSFQLESSGIQELTVGLQPDNLNEISAILALYRPGPMGSNVHKEYIERKFGRKQVIYLHPSLEPILNKTYGLLIYQEQLLKIATDVAGLTIMEADDLRKIVGKKKVELMPKQREKFVKGCMDTSKMHSLVANRLFNEMEHHASYSFGEGHATGYMFLSYVTTYLHAKYPAEYMAAALSTVTEKEDRLREYLNECQRLGLEVRLPSVRDSDVDFKVQDDTHIYYGLGAIKGITSNSIDPVVKSREEYEFSTWHAFLRNVDASVLNKKTMDHYLAAGAFDSLFVDEPYFVDIPSMTKAQYIEMLLGEFDELNAFISDHPYKEIQEIAGHTIDFRPIKEAYALDVGDILTTAGIVVNIDKKMSRKGKRMFKLLIQDLDNSITVDIMPKVAEDMDEKPFTKGDFLVVKGVIDKFGDDENAIVSIRMYEHELTSIIKLSEEASVYLKAEYGLTLNRIDKLLDIIKVNKGDSVVYLDFYDEANKANVRFKFKSTINKECEPKLRKILEV